jgi:hypothetical protein
MLAFGNEPIKPGFKDPTFRCNQNIEWARTKPKSSLALCCLRTIPAGLRRNAIASPTDPGLAIAVSRRNRDELLVQFLLVPSAVIARNRYLDLVHCIKRIVIVSVHQEVIEPGALVLLVPV